MKATKKSIVVEVDAHHNVEDFRPYKFRFVDKGSRKANEKIALFRAIIKEGAWNGWFEDEYQMFYNLQKEVESAVGKLVDGHGGKRDEVVVIARKELADGSMSTTERDPTWGLVIWRADDGFGFGFGSRHQYDDKIDPKSLSSEHTDKYHNKWISFVK